MFNNNNHLHLGTLRSHQCQGSHATPANTPTLWGGSASSTKYPHDSSRPPTPSFPPYDVRTLHFVACGRPWLLHWRGVHAHRCWSHFWGAQVPRMVHLLHMTDMVQRERERARERARARSWSHFWGKVLGRCGNTQIRLLHMKHMVHDTHDMIRTHKTVGHIFGANS